jgi:8-oxo-dGTP pyrophosphatase MutT (NUDIX family)
MKRALLTVAYGIYGLQWYVGRPVTLGVRLMLIREGAVLLIRHSYQRDWNFPGGGVKRGESLVHAAAREAREEVGALLLEPPGLVGIFTNFGTGKSDHVALFVSEHFAWQPPTDRWEIEARVLFAVDALPPDAPRALYRHLAQAGRRGLTGKW